MLGMMFVAHLLGDYVLQFNSIARWKARSLWGVLVHGGIVTLATLACAALVDVGWLPYALLIGIAHTLIDVVKAHLVKAKGPRQEMLYYFLDQLVHAVVITLTVLLSGASAWLSGLTARLGLSGSVVLALIGYLLLLQPAWVSLRLLVRGVWGADAAPYLGSGEKFQPMLERVLMATLVLTGFFYLTPLVLLPRRMSSLQVQGNGMMVWMHLTSHWAETFMGTLLAVTVGIVLRLLI